MKLALVLHELGTNARKHGALSVPEGRLSARWALRLNGASEFRLDWVETAGPKVPPPSERGFGTTLIEQSVLSCGGQITVDYADQGMRCRITLPYSEPIQIESSPGMFAAVGDAMPNL